MGLQIPSFGTSLLLIACTILFVLPAPAAAFGAGNIPSISTIEGSNFRHGGKCLRRVCTCGLANVRT